MYKYRKYTIYRVLAIILVIIVTLLFAISEANNKITIFKLKFSYLIRYLI